MSFWTLSYSPKLAQTCFLEVTAYIRYFKNFSFCGFERLRLSLWNNLYRFIDNDLHLYKEEITTAIVGLSVAHWVWTSCKIHCYFTATKVAGQKLYSTWRMKLFQTGPLKIHQSGVTIFIRSPGIVISTFKFNQCSFLVYTFSWHKLQG